MKKIFNLLAVIMMAVSAFAGRTFSAGEVIYMDCNAVSWWCNDNCSQTMYFIDATNASTPVVGTEYGEAGSKIYAFAAPAGTFEYIYEQRGTWNKTGNISLTGTEGKNFIKSFAQDSPTVTWGNLGDAPDPDVTYYLYVTDGSEHWDNLYVYAWGGKDFFGAWPGTNVRTATQENGKYKLAMTGQANSEVHLIFHNNSGSQYDSDVFTLTADHNVTTLDPDAPLVAAGVALWPTSAVLPTAIPTEVKVLSLNNSLIHYENEWQDDIFNQMAAAMGKNAVWTAHTNLGKSLQYHWDEGEGLTETGTPSARKLMRDNAYTHIILQEQTAKPRTDFAAFRASVIDWVNYIRTQGANPSAVIILPINWAYGNSANFAAENAEFKQNYLNLAQELGLVLAPVGVAYDLAAGAEGMGIMAQGGRWFKDDRHPTQMTTYLGACIEYATIFGVDPTTITWAPSTITAAEATSMRQYAQQAINATDQPVNIYNHSIRFEVREIDANGLSVAKTTATYSGAQLTDSTFRCATAGQYTVNAVAGTNNLSSTVTVADMQTTVVTTPAIAVHAGQTIVTENFDSMSYPAADATVIEKGYYGTASNLPTAWRIERNQVGPRQIGAFADASAACQYQGGVSLPSNAANGTWNLGMNGSTDRAVGGMTTGVDNGARAINIMAHLTNDGTQDFDTIRISYDIEKYREGSNANIFYVKLFTSTNGAVWTPAGDNFEYLNPKGSGQTGFATVPGATTSVAADLVYHFAAGTDLYLCWSITPSVGDNCASAPCLAIDNVNLEFVKAAAPASAHYLYVDDQTGWATLGVYAYGASTLYGAWPGQAMIDTKVIDGVTYKVFPFDVTENANYNLIFNNWNQGAQANDFVVNEARDYYLTVTATTVTERNTGTALNTLENDAPAQKIIRGNQVFIVREGVVYNALGIVIR